MEVNKTERVKDELMVRGHHFYMQILASQKAQWQSYWLLKYIAFGFICWLGMKIFLKPNFLWPAVFFGFIHYAW
jgi:hypothetical protein